MFESVAAFRQLILTGAIISHDPDLLYTMSFLVENLPNQGLLARLTVIEKPLCHARCVV